MIPIKVTEHAKRRYLERIVGVDFSPFDRRRIGDGDAVAAVCAEAGIAPDYVNGLIENEVDARVPATARLRGSRCVVKGQTARYVVIHGRFVATVLPLT
jgi:hypothetical protein